jgi:hypothetical protein
VADFHFCNFTGPGPAEFCALQQLVSCVSLCWFMARPLTCCILLCWDPTSWNVLLFLVLSQRLVPFVAMLQEDLNFGFNFFTGDVSGSN